MVRKLSLPFPLLSDPDGAVIREYGVWHEERQMARPAIVVVNAVGRVAYRYVGQDFADRPGDDEVFRALEEAGGEA